MNSKKVRNVSLHILGYHTNLFLYRKCKAEGGWIYKSQDTRFTSWQFINCELQVATFELRIERSPRELRVQSRVESYLLNYTF